MDAAQQPAPPRAGTIRSHLILEIAAGLTADADQPLKQTKVLLRAQGTDDWPLCLFGSSTNEGIDAVVAGEAQLAVINPSAALTLAYRGTGTYPAPQPVRPIAVVPSFDRYVFAVKHETLLARFEEIGERRYPLRISVRGQADHYLHVMLDHIVHAAGFTLDDVRSWGGSVSAAGFSPPRAGDARFTAIARGELDAIFDEGAAGWLDAAIDAGMTILPVAEETVAKLEGRGYRRGTLDTRTYPKLTQDVLTLDFSGWPIFVHADAPDDLVARICDALDRRKALIPWEGTGPLPVERMCRDGADTPLDVPLHPAAERFWKQRGYLYG
jgi:NMT1 family protein